MRILTALVAISIVSGGVAQAAAGKPNIVLIVADDLGYGELGSYGGKEIPTPNLDDMAAAGIRMAAGYVSCPVCSPTRAGLITGRYQQRFGHEFNPGPVRLASKAFGLPLNQKTMPELLKSHGYATGMVGKWHLGHGEYHPLARGFDEFFGFLDGSHSYTEPKKDAANLILRGREPVDEKEYLTDALTREAIAYIDRHKDHPFFLYLTYNAVHAPLQAPTKYLKRFESIRNDRRRTFAAMLSALDDGVGSVLAKLRTNGIEENTLIVFVSDNGGPTHRTSSRNGPLRGKKGEVFEGGIRVPFLMQWKGHIPAGKTYDQPVIALDLLPTFLAAAGGKAPEGLQLDGVDLIPFLNGDGNNAPHESLFWRYGQQAAVRKGNWKYVRRTEEGEQLYDLNSDIGETTNLASSKPEILDELKKTYASWNAELVAPLWRRAGQPRN
ncbi:MAG: sulfatase [Planctomycetaceae bacterium]